MLNCLLRQFKGKPQQLHGVEKTLEYEPYCAVVVCLCDGWKSGHFFDFVHGSYTPCVETIKEACNTYCIALFVQKLKTAVL